MRIGEIIKPLTYSPDTRKTISNREFMVIKEYPSYYFTECIMHGKPAFKECFHKFDLGEYEKIEQPEKDIRIPHYW